MNDIERLAAVIKQRRQQAKLAGRPSNLVTRNVDIELSHIHAIDTHSVENAEADALNDTLLHDLVTGFGLDGSRMSSAEELPEAMDATVATNRELTSRPLSGGTIVDKQASKRQDNKKSIVHIPIEKLATEGFITPITKRGRMTEQFRRIKRPLLQNIDRDADNDTGRNRNIIMVTSSLSGEGKTFTSINLAMSLAMEREKKVLLVDTDVLKNTASGVLEVSKDALGLTDVLVGDVHDPSDVILRTNVDNFTYMPSGSSQQHTNELLSSARMKQLFDELSSHHHDRIIVLDCPPILQTNEATVITDYAGQVVFVVAEEETSQRYVMEALSQIPKEHYVGVVLNKSHKRILGNDYDYTYEYG